MMPICATRSQMIFRNQKMLAQHALTEAKLVRQLHRAYDFLVAERQLPGLAQRGNFKGVRNCNVKFHEVRLITDGAPPVGASPLRSEHTSELQSLMRISYAVFCLKKKTKVSEIHVDTTDIRKPHYTSLIHRSYIGNI